MALTDINYGNRGWKAIEQHLFRKLHSVNKRTKSLNQSLPGKYKNRTYFVTVRLSQHIVICINIMSCPRYKIINYWKGCYFYL